MSKILIGLLAYAAFAGNACALDVYVCDDGNSTFYPETSGYTGCVLHSTDESWKKAAEQSPNDPPDISSMAKRDRAVAALMEAVNEHYRQEGTDLPADRLSAETTFAIECANEARKNENASLYDTKELLVLCLMMDEK